MLPNEAKAYSLPSGGIWFFWDTAQETVVNSDDPNNQYKHCGYYQNKSFFNGFSYGICEDLNRSAQIAAFNAEIASSYGNSVLSIWSYTDSNWSGSWHDYYYIIVRQTDLREAAYRNASRVEADIWTLHCQGGCDFKSAPKNIGLEFINPDASYKEYNSYYYYTDYTAGVYDYGESIVYKKIRQQYSPAITDVLETIIFKKTAGPSASGVKTFTSQSPGISDTIDYPKPKAGQGERCHTFPAFLTLAAKEYCWTEYIDGDSASGVVVNGKVQFKKGSETIDVKVESLAVKISSTTDTKWKPVSAPTMDDGTWKINDIPPGESYKAEISEKLAAGSTFEALKQVLGDVVGLEIGRYINGTATFKISGDRKVTPNPVIIYLTLDDKGVADSIVDLLNDALNAIMTKIISGLSNALQVISGWISGALDWGNNINDNNDALSGIWTNVRNISLSLLTLAIIFIAFANILGFDIEKYGLNRILPKLIIGVGLAFFSFMICGIILNLCSGLQSLMVGKGMNASQLQGLSGTTLGEQISNAKDAAVKAGNLFVYGIVLVFVIVIALVLFLWLLIVCVLRIMVIMFLVSIAPLAFMMNVLPFTAFLYKKWWNTFVKWAFMGPGILFFLYLTNEFLWASLKGNWTGSLQPIMYLLLAGCGVALAAMVPMSLGGEIIRGVQGSVKKGTSSMPYKQTVGRATDAAKKRAAEFRRPRQQYKALALQQKMSEKRAAIEAQDRGGLRGRVDRWRTGKGPLVGKQNDLVAERVHDSEIQLRKMESSDIQKRLDEIRGPGRTLDLSNPEARSLLKAAASTIDTAGMSPETKKDVARAVAAGSGINADANLKRVADAFQANSNADKFQALYVDAKKKGYFGELEHGEELEETAVKKATGKRTIDKTQDDLDVQIFAAGKPHPLAESVIKEERDAYGKFATETRGAIKADGKDYVKKMAEQAAGKDSKMFEDLTNEPHYETNVGSRNQEAHERYGLDFKEAHRRAGEESHGKAAEETAKSTEPATEGAREVHTTDLGGRFDIDKAVRMAEREGGRIISPPPSPQAESGGTAHHGSAAHDNVSESHHTTIEGPTAVERSEGARVAPSQEPPAPQSEIGTRHGITAEERSIGERTIEGIRGVEKAIEDNAENIERLSEKTEPDANKPENLPPKEQ